VVGTGDAAVTSRPLWHRRRRRTGFGAGEQPSCCVAAGGPHTSPSLRPADRAQPWAEPLRHQFPGLVPLASVRPYSRGATVHRQGIPSRRPSRPHLDRRCRVRADELPPSRSAGKPHLAASPGACLEAACRSSPAPT
jgi:hypothetical protein